MIRKEIASLVGKMWKDLTEKEKEMMGIYIAWGTSHLKEKGKYMVELEFECGLYCKGYYEILENEVVYYPIPTARIHSKYSPTIW